MNEKKQIAEAAETTSYTRGPLEAQAFDETTGEWAVYAQHAPVGGKVTAFCKGPNAEGNARLYAAAPAMYAHLVREEEFLATVEGCVDCDARRPEFCETHWEGYGDICDSRRAAISKATA